MFCPKCGAEALENQLFCSRCGNKLAENASGPTTADLCALSPEDLTERNFLQQSLAGKFEISEELGKGGFGVVFKALDIKLNRYVAIKALHLVKSSDESLVKRFLKEAQLAAALEHPNIVRIYAIDSAGPVNYFIMEYIEGTTIKEFIEQSIMIPVYPTVKICRKVAEALAFAHSKGIVHRDIKPHNIILKNSETPVVTDFGIAKALDTEGTQLTTGALGSPLYISPEQLRNEDIDPRTDQYAMGIMMFEMLTGSPPFKGSGLALLHKQLNEQPPDLRKINSRIPKSLVALINRLLSKEKTDRFADMNDVIKALDALNVQEDEIDPISGLPTEQMIIQSVSDLVPEIKQALKKRQYDKAIRLCEKGHKFFPGNPELDFLLRQARSHKEASGKAKAFLNEGIEKFHARQYTIAIEKWYEALQLDESNTEIEKLIDQAKKQQFAHKKLVELFREAQGLVQKQKYTDALKKLGVIENQDPDFTGLKELKRKAEAAEIEARELDNLIQEGKQLQGQFRYHESIKVFQSVLERDSTRIEARKGLEKSRAALKRIEEIQKLQSRWQRYRKSGRFDAAVKILIRLQQLRPEKKEYFAKIITAIRSEQKLALKMKTAESSKTQREKKMDKSPGMRVRIPDKTARKPIQKVFDPEAKTRIINVSDYRKSPAASKTTGKIQPGRTRTTRNAHAVKKQGFGKLIALIILMVILMILAGLAIEKLFPHSSTEMSNRNQSSRTSFTPQQIGNSIHVTHIPKTVPTRSIPESKSAPKSYNKQRKTPRMKRRSSFKPGTGNVAEKSNSGKGKHTRPAMHAPGARAQKNTEPTPGGQGEISQTLRHRIGVAVSEMNQKNYRKSMDIVNAILHDYPGLPRAVFLKRKLQRILVRCDRLYHNAREYYRAGNYAMARKELINLLIEDPYNDQAVALLDTVNNALNEQQGEN